MKESNSEETKAICPNCGAELDPGVAQGLCPRCALAEVGAETERATSRTSRLFEAPPLERIAAAFPQLEIIELIGRGGMGAVYKARQPHLDRMIALKVLPHSLAELPEFTERFTREAQLLAKLNHPNIVTVHDFGQAGGFFYLIMELVDGVNLREAMRAGRFTPEQALEVTPKICEALQFAHGEGVLHRDIKPENILLDAKGRVKIADFGIAKLLGESAAAGQTLTGSLAPGTPQYMAPEQIEHPGDVDHRADIYSLGVVFYEMLTGELPLGRFAPPSEKSAVDSQVDEIVFRALAKERDQRQQSAGQVKTEIETAAVARERHPAYRIPAPRDRENPRCIRNSNSLAWPAAWALILVVSGSLLGILIGFLASASEDTQVAKVRAELAQEQARSEAAVGLVREEIKQQKSELSRLNPDSEEYRKLNAEIEVREEELRYHVIRLSNWYRGSLERVSSRAPTGAIIGFCFFVIVVIPGVLLGARALHRYRLSGEKNLGIALTAGVAAFALPILTLDIGIIALFRSQDLAVITALAVDAALIWAICRWVKSPPPEHARARFLAKFEPAAAGPPRNPWRRAFWLIVLVFVAPGALLVVITVAGVVAGLFYQSHRSFAPPPEFEFRPEPEKSAGSDPQSERCGMFSPLVHQDQSLDPPHRFQAIATLYPGYLMTLGIEIESPNGVRRPVDGLDGWLANVGPVRAEVIRWEIENGAIRLMEGVDDGDRVFTFIPLEKSLSQIDWKMVRGDRSFWFSDSPDEWAVGSVHDYLLFEGAAPGGAGRHRIWGRIGLYPLQPGVELQKSTTAVHLNDSWRTLIGP